MIKSAPDKRPAVVNFATANQTSVPGLPGLNDAHVRFFKAFRPSDMFEDLGYRKYDLIDLKLDERSMETVAVYEVALPCDCSDVTVYTCEYKIVGDKPCRVREHDPFDMDYDEYTLLVRERGAP
ncbi:hypothetical protein Rleg2_1167 [Rhizobium leguminosarum bv. trifolii WSM2304]|uniref:Uncharacterized protein n=1 Tax=Rhizobium leguminosarum bv. trifolii (strain WSM2304) TaxID=395492 RepID=A0ABF7QKF7_RHILW|nr:hypothetical protein [Rhizobium leguminosarum]ACI54461.1 hypothetical protein Rleg2_1167 [Rhizobium leguminosarum bv. trifolii WSM2304]